jgi:hypothetical protein
MAHKPGALVGANVWLDGSKLALGDCTGKELLGLEAVILSGPQSDQLWPGTTPKSSSI